MIAHAAFALAVAAAVPEDIGFTTDPARLKADAVRELVAQLADPRKGREAARRLVRFGRSAVGPVVEALGSKKLQVRFYAATVLDIVGDEASTKALHARLLDDKEDPIVRTIAARAMGRADYAPAAEVLLRLARAHAPPPDADGDREREDAPPSSPRRPRRGRDDEEKRDVLEGNEEFRFEVMRALAYIGVGEADDLLIAALADQSSRVREVAAVGLGDHRVLAALGALRKALDDADGAAAAAAARAIGKLGRPASAAVPDLVVALDRKDARVQRAAMGALAITTGRSFRTPRRWRRWWEERKAAKAEAVSAKGKEKEEEFPLPAVIATDIFRRPSGGPGPADAAREPDGPTPPALRMPWETEETEEAPDAAEADGE